ncbi:OmpA family protein [Brevundimonas sp.]|uniref:OmpA family protein n=1 Tax=Brevundimonas sp. TaxID=1871086 RepID=UPI0028A16C92|nr:OmpA family protein [Brevundimonas sp.]
MRTPWALVAVVTAISNPASAHEFIDWFDYGQTELSPAGYRMVQKVASYTHARHLVQIVVSGHMDTAEAREFSDELSRRRAQSVATELVRLGVNPAHIEIVGYGANHLARPTPSDTRNQLNRRVLVDMNFP